MAKLGILLFLAGLCVVVLANPLSNGAVKHEANIDIKNNSLSRVPRQIKRGIYLDVLFGILSPIATKISGPVRVEEKTEKPKSKYEDDKTKKLKKCQIPIKTLKQNNPLILEPTAHDEIVIPDKKGIINLVEHQQLFLSCTNGKEVLIEGWTSNTASTVTVQCVEKNSFKTSDAQQVLVNFKDIKCNDYIPSAVNELGATVYTADADDGIPEHVQPFFIGFDVEEGQFAPVLGGFTDQENMVPYWVHNVVTSLSASNKQTFTEKNLIWKHDGCCSKAAPAFHNMYKPSEQKRSFRAQFDCDTYPDHATCKFYGDADADISLFSDFFFNRGHLAAKSSYIYASEGVATFAYVNQAPQPAKINREKWAGIEAYTRSMAQMMLTMDGLSVFTGTYGQLTWAHPADGKQKPVFLHTELHREELVNYVPIPKYFWKIVMDPKDKNKGVVFVTVNNPFLRADEVDDYLELCSEPKTDLSDNLVGQLGILNAEPGDGYTYVCSVQDFMSNEKVKTIPGYATIEERTRGIYFKNWTDLLKIKKGKNDKRNNPASPDACVARHP